MRGCMSDPLGLLRVKCVCACVRARSDNTVGNDLFTRGVSFTRRAPPSTLEHTSDYERV